MERKLIVTEDGSHSITVPALGETYHSAHGAIQESLHVFIAAGLLPVLETNPASRLHIFEIGFGTGLNALLTAIEARKQQRAIHYTSIELYPLTTAEAAALNYCEQLQAPEWQPFFTSLHTCEWEKEVVLDPLFTVHKIKRSLPEFNGRLSPMALIYFDAFSPVKQPELWTVSVFQYLFRLSQPGAVLVTYCSKGIVRRALVASGFSVEKLRGPKGKREMVRATRNAAAPVTAPAAGA